MSMFIDEVNRSWEKADPVSLACFILWRLNHIHPFVNGNGRTARVASYYALCLKVGAWLPGDTLLPELLRRERPDYVAALKHADASIPTGNLDLSSLHALVTKLLNEQMGSVDVDSVAKNSGAT